MRFRVLLHNIQNEKRPVISSRFEEALIQCRDIFHAVKDRVPKTGPGGKRPRRKIYYVRVPNSQPFKPKPRKPLVTQPTSTLRSNVAVRVSTQNTPRRPQVGFLDIDRVRK